MNQNRLPSILALALGLLLTPATHAEPLKAVTWNIEWFPGGRPYAKSEERAAHAKAVQAEFAKIKPDIFLAQEVTNEKAFAELVATVPGMSVNVFSRFPDEDPDKVVLQQCAIASNLKANSAFFEVFKPARNLPNLRRGFAFAALEHPDGGLIMLYSVHLKSNWGSETPEGEKDIADTRAESVRQIIAHKEAMEKQFEGRKIMGWLIAGDLNTNDDGQFPMCTAVADLVKAGFHNTWDTTPKEERLTWHPTPGDDRFQPTTFDYVMTMGFRKKQAEVISVPRDTSDHDPVLFLLEAE